MKKISLILFGVLALPVTALSAYVPFRSLEVRAQVVADQTYPKYLDGTRIMICYQGKLTDVEVIGKAPKRGQMITVIIKRSLMVNYYYYVGPYL